MYFKGKYEMLRRFALRFATLQTHGADLTLASDDIGYQKTATILLETGMLIYHELDKPPIHIMPGFPVFLVTVFYFFGNGNKGLFVAKLIIILLGVLIILLTYKIGTYLLNPAAGLIGAFLLAVYPPEIVVENLTLTEGQFLFFSLGLLYWSLKLADTHKTKHFLLFSIVLTPTSCFISNTIIYISFNEALSIPHYDEASDSIFYNKKYMQGRTCACMMRRLC